MSERFKNVYEQLARMNGTIDTRLRFLATVLAAQLDVGKVELVFGTNDKQFTGSTSSALEAISTIYRHSIEIPYTPSTQTEQASSMLTVIAYDNDKKKLQETKRRLQQETITLGEILCRLLVEEQLKETEKELERLQAAQKTIQLALIEDSLTGLLNPRGLRSALYEEIESAKRNKNHLGLIYCDLDHFKKVNDEYGHAEGDSVLRETGHLLRSNARSYETVGRKGGEEFVVILRQTDYEAAIKAAERFRKIIDNYKYSLPQPDNHITMSFGVVATDCLLGETAQIAEILLNAADYYLYEAKHAGRNCIRPTLDAL